MTQFIPKEPMAGFSPQQKIYFGKAQALLTATRNCYPHTELSLAALLRPYTSYIERAYLLTQLQALPRSIVIATKLLGIY
jgi:hypothetical protein